MSLLIDYQQERGANLRGPANPVGAFLKIFGPLQHFPALLERWLGAGAERQGPPKAPPTPPYRAVVAHTDHDFDRGTGQNGGVFHGQLGRGWGICHKNQPQGVRG